MSIVDKRKPRLWDRQPWDGKKTDRVAFQKVLGPVLLGALWRLSRPPWWEIPLRVCPRGTTELSEPFEESPAPWKEGKPLEHQFRHPPALTCHWDSRQWGSEVLWLHSLPRLCDSNPCQESSFVLFFPPCKGEQKCLPHKTYKTP